MDPIPQWHILVLVILEYATVYFTYIVVIVYA